LTEHTNTSALSHLRVIDLTRILAGPWATQTLADLGAEVIKVERPEGGDDTRAWGPPFLKPDASGGAPLSAYFCTANRNKKSLALDFASPEGTELLRELVASSDVFIENFKVGGLAKYGLDYESLKAINPGLIYCSITGFGQTGPYAERAGYDFIIQAMSGLMSVTGQAPGTAGDEPMKIGVALTDILTGLYASIGILTALTHRDKTGAGQHIDMSLMDVSVASMANQALNYLVSGNAPQRMGNAHPNIVPYQVFPTEDGHLIITVGNDRQFQSLCEVLGNGELAADPRYLTNQLRVANRDTLVDTIKALTRTGTTAHWIAELGVAKVPCGPINDLHDVFNDPQVVARGMRIEQPAAGQSNPVPGVASPLHLSATPPQYRSAPPVLGEHTREVLQNLLNLSNTRTRELAEAGICAFDNPDSSQ
jgi:crotonobetainyl-CoA:carnitine CoA-transferase CaiB-like acyl-CoA transferase